MASVIRFCLWCIGCVLMTPQTVQAGHCADRAHVVQRLAAVYGETRQSGGFGPQGSLVEVFAAQHTGSWTIVVTDQGGQTCLVAAGQAFAWRRPWMAALDRAV